MDSSSYYDKNAVEYIRNTIDADIAVVRNRFLAYISPGGMILDAGCGSGRDSRCFHENGYDVYAFDASAAMVESCRRFIGDRVKLSTFMDYDSSSRFDGIWGCASFLHIEAGEFSGILEKYLNLLKHSGVLYMSFKYGEINYIKDGRYFLCFTDATFAGVVKAMKGVEIADMFITDDVREGRSGERWLNVLVRNC